MTTEAVDTFPREIWVGGVRYVRETNREQGLREHDWGNGPALRHIDPCFCGLFTASPHDRTPGCPPSYTRVTTGSTTG